MKQINTQAIHHEIDSLDANQLEQVKHFISHLKSIATNKPEKKLQIIRDRLERSANSGDPIELDKAFQQIEKLHQKQLN